MLQFSTLTAHGIRSGSLLPELLGEPDENSDIHKSCHHALEDETGTINVVVWRSTAEKYRSAMLQSRRLTVYGHVERVTTGVSPIVHLSPLLGSLTVRSHDFH